MTNPPKLPLRFLRWFCHPDLLPSIEGDLIELFEERLVSRGTRKAKWQFTWDVVKLFRPSIIRPTNYHSVQSGLLWNNLKIARRNLLRYKLFSTINILGLSLGLSMSLLILTHILNELSYEHAYPKHDRIFRVASTNWAKNPPSLAAQLKDEMPEIQNIGRLYYLYQGIVSTDEKQILVDYPYLSDPSIFDIFDVKFILGNPKTALSEPDQIVLTKSLTDKLMGKGVNPIGKQVQINGYRKYTICAIVENLPDNSHLKVDCFMSMKGSWVEKNDSPVWKAVSIFALFDSKQDAENVSEKLSAFQERFMASRYSPEEIKAEGDFFELHPIDDIHLHSHREKETEVNSDISNIYIFSALAIFILVVAILNFLNLYIAQCLNRIKEIATRKVLGAVRSQLIMQFLTEAFFLVSISAAVAVVLIVLALPHYNQLSTIQLRLDEILSFQHLGLMGVLTLFVGLIAGGYPALYLSKFGTGRLKFAKISSRAPVRMVLLGFQFFIAVFLISATLIVNEQMGFIKNKDLGIASEEILAVKLHARLWYEAVHHYDKVKDELTKHVDITEVALSDKLVGDRFGYEDYYLDGDRENQISARYLRADANILKTLNAKIILGELSPSSPEMQYVINQKAADLLQEEELIGRSIDFGYAKGKMVAIVEDFHFASLHNEVNPLVIEVKNDLNFAGYLLIRFSSNNIHQTLNKIDDVLATIAPETLLVYRFLDDQLNGLYKAETNLFAVFKLFSSVIIFLACLGLFALFAFMVQSRTKELGIRKTLGASLVNLLVLLSRKYYIILGVVILFSIPVASYFADFWLANFAYQVDLDWSIYAWPGLLIILLASVALLSQSWKIAMQNPVESLRDE